MATPARALAHRVLVRLERTRSTLSDLLGRAPADDLEPRERDFAHELILGTLRRRGLVDHALAPLADRPLRTLDPGVRAALRLGAYQLLCLRVPEHAAVHEAVELARSTRPAAGAFVNAVLRRLASSGPPPLPSAESDPLAWLTSEGSLPRWLAERWLRRLGPQQAVARARAFLEPPAHALRLNPRRPDARARAEEAGLELCALAVPGAFEARRGRAQDLAREGVLYLQDQGSQLVAHLAAARGRVLDACASPGGKALLVADLMGEQALVVAAEASLPRLRTLRSLVERWGAANIACLGADARRPPFREAFDAVLLDAPCSGLGTLGRHPDIRWRASARDLARQAARQRELLVALAPLVERGGLLVYGVCSLEPEETQDVVLPFLAQHPEFQAAQPPEWAGPFERGPFFEARPEAQRSDGFFAARLRRS